MSRLTAELILSLVDRVTAPARQIAGTVETLQGRLKANDARLDAMRGRMVEAAAAGWGLYQAIKAPVMAAVEFESAMADVRKVVDFPTPDAFRTMSADIIAMSTRLPMAATGIAEIVAAAGQSGMAGGELLAFTEIAAKVGVAFDMAAGDTGEALAKIKTALQLTVADTGLLADAINHLSNSSASSASDIVDYMKRVGAAGTQYGFLPAQTAAIGAAMISAGAEAEVAATSFLNVGRALARGESATKRQKSALASLGLEATAVAKRLQEDAVGTLRDVLVRINELPEHLRSSTISDIFGDEARALAPLITQMNLYDDAVNSVAQSSTYLGSSQREFEARAATTANAMQLFRNKVAAASIAIGSALLPALNGVMDTLGPTVMAIARFAEENPRLTSTLVAVAAALVGFRVAAIAAQFAVLWMRGGILTAAIAGLGGMGAAASRAASAISFLSGTAATGSSRRVAQDAVASAKALVAQTSASYAAARAAQALARDGRLVGANLRDATATLGHAGKNASAAQVALAAANAQLLATGPASRSAALGLGIVRGAMTGLKVAMIGTGIGAALVAIATAGAWIYQNWSGIQAMFAGIAEGIRTSMPAAGAAIDVITGAVSGLFDWFGRLTGPVDATGAAWTALGVTIGTTIGNAIAAVTNFVAQVIQILSSVDLGAAGLAMMQSLLNGLREGAASVLSYVAGIGAGVKSSISNAANGAWSSMKNAVGLGEPAIDGARAAGGPIAGGRTYLVGEEGPELITPSRSGYVHTADETAAMGRGSRGGGRSSAPARSGPVTVTFGNIVVSSPPGASAREVADEMGRMVRDMMRGGQFDKEWSVR